MRDSQSNSGQWIGYGIGEPSGDVLVDIDNASDGPVADAYLFHEPSSGIPASYITFPIEEDLRKGKVIVQPRLFDARVGYLLSEQGLKEFYPNIAVPKEVELNFEFLDNSSLSVEWRSNVGTFGNVHLSRFGRFESEVDHLNGEIVGWKDFKSFVAQQDPSRMIYRGQAKPYSLRTSFHRTGRKRLPFYRANDVPVLHRALSSKLKHFFDLNHPEQLGAFLNLAQHHGFPTPLLDWTYSPYIAAYFAYGGLRNVRRSTQKVRIFCLDKKALVTETFQSQYLSFVYPHLSILEALSIENDRAMPQQGLLTLTNVENIEYLLRVLERRIGKNLLTIVDLPYSEADEVNADLRLMGITRSSLFPGIDSICQDTRDRLFP